MIRNLLKQEMVFQVTDLLIAFGIAILLYIYLHLTRNFKYWKDQNVPYAKPTLFFGNAFPLCSIQKPMAELLNDFYKATTSKVYGFFAFDQPFLLIRDPDLIKSVLIKDFDYFADRSVLSNRKDDKFGSSILFVLKNPFWRSMRIKITPALTSGKIKSMTPLMVAASKGLIAHINKGISQRKEFYARSLAMMFTTDVITSCAFGISANSFENENAEFLTASKRVFALTLSRGIQFVSSFFAPILFKFFKMKFIDGPSANFMEKAFLETLYEREKHKIPRGDLIDILIQIKNNEKQDEVKLDKDMLVSQAIQFFIAGYETTGSTIFFSLFELSVNPHIQEKLREEIKTVLTKHGKISYEAIQDMTYLEMIVCETLRKYPVVPFLDRRCTKTYTISGSDIIVKKGMAVYISLLGLHYDSKYFVDPYKYDPERFSPENRSKIPNFVYMPFGEGLHNCIGARFALVNAKVGLVSLLSNFELKQCSKLKIEKIKFNANGFLLAPTKDIKMQFISNPLCYSS